jgi:hypothetical protein
MLHGIVLCCSGVFALHLSVIWIESDVVGLR